MNFLVVIPKFTTSSAQEYIFPVGVGYIAASLRQKGFSVKGLDLNRFDAPPQDVLAQTIKDHSIDVVATGTISAHYDKVKTVLIFLGLCVLRDLGVRILPCCDG